MNNILLENLMASKIVDKEEIMHLTIIMLKLVKEILGTKVEVVAVADQ